MCLPSKKQEEEIAKMKATREEEQRQKEEEEEEEEEGKDSASGEKEAAVATPQRRPSTIYEKEMAARTKEAETESRDYFGISLKKRKRDAEEETKDEKEKAGTEKEKEEKAKEETYHSRNEEDEEAAEERAEVEERRKRRRDKVIAEQLVEELVDDVKGRNKGREGSMVVQVVSDASLDVGGGEQPMEGVEEGPVHMVEEEGDEMGPQMPQEASGYDVLMPPSMYGIEDAYPQPPPADSDEMLFAAYPDTDAQYAATPAPHMHATTTTTTATSQPAKPVDAAMVVTKQLSQQEQRDRGMATVFRRDDSKQFDRPRKRDEREKNPAFVPDEYAECYPG